METNHPRIPLEINGKYYIAIRDTNIQRVLASDYQQHGYGSYVLMMRFLVVELNDTTKPLACFNFAITHLSKLSWENSNNDSIYGSDKVLEFSLANLIPYLDIDFTNAKDQLDKAGGCITIIFDMSKETGYVNDLKKYFVVKQTGDIFKTARQIVFGNQDPQIETIQDNILETLCSYRQEYPTTKMSIGELYASIPATNKEMLYALSFLEEEKFIDVLYSPEDKDSMISVRITSKGVKKLKKPEKVYYPEEIKDKPFPQSKSISQGDITVQGDLYQTLGNDSPIVVNTEEAIKTIFNRAIQEIETRDPENKDKMIKVLIELKEAIKKGDMQKTKEKYGALKKLGNWITGTLSSFVGSAGAAMLTNQWTPIT